ncbi:hypothetical protein AN958_05974 [Leucoagaricus sp. SymC.cos]|nr:hypothetical protein AN958_05974 [Leucoagaricus sp. SymC.cos]
MVLSSASICFSEVVLGWGTVIMIPTRGDLGIAIGNRNIVALDSSGAVNSRKDEGSDIVANLSQRDVLSGSFTVSPGISALGDTIRESVRRRRRTEIGGQ